jgi:hypothetical protein
MYVKILAVIEQQHLTTNGKAKFGLTFTPNL